MYQRFRVLIDGPWHLTVFRENPDGSSRMLGHVELTLPAQHDWDRIGVATPEEIQSIEMLVESASDRIEVGSYEPFTFEVDVP